jgi:hypothetical protein
LTTKDPGGGLCTETLEGNKVLPGGGGSGLKLPIGGGGLKPLAGGGGLKLPVGGGGLKPLGTLSSVCERELAGAQREVVEVALAGLVDVFGRGVVGGA